MPVKCTGAEFLRFYNDKAWWFSVEDKTAANHDEGTYWEDASVFVNGEQIPEFEFDFDKDLKSTDIVSVSGGVVFGKVVGVKEPSVEAYLRRWLKAQTTTAIVVDCPKEKLDAILVAIKAAGGSVQQ